MSENHPPIPPNVGNHFERFDGKWNFYHYGVGWVELGKDNGMYWGKIIASVARCAWIDECEKAHSDYKDGDDYKLVLNRMDECNENADAWAKWGRGEAASEQ